MPPAFIDGAGAVLFALAIVHTFSAALFRKLAHSKPDHAGLWHLLGEVEVVFGAWAIVLILLMATTQGPRAATAYLEQLSFTEPMFVFAIMVIAGSRPLLQAARQIVFSIAKRLPMRAGVAIYFVVLSLVPLLGSFITEPAAMTLAALILLERYYSKGLTARLKYATLGVLFVNISIGGTLTPFAAPPVLMVAAKWNWDMHFMAMHFGWKAVLAVVANALVVTFVFRRELGALAVQADSESDEKVPALVVAAHLALLTGVVVFSHHAVVFLGFLLCFLGLAESYPRYQGRLILREGIMVGFFLAGLVILGGPQKWWLQPVLSGMSADALYYGATGLTAFTDNAALTYLGTLVDHLSPEARYALVSGAVTGGGLTVIANAPNPAGFSILQKSFEQGAIHPAGLLLAALPPTAMAIIAFRLF